MRVYSDVRPGLSAYTTAAAGATATLTLIPPPGEYIVIDWIHFSYSKNPVNGLLSVTDSTAGILYLSEWIVKDGLLAGFMNFSPDTGITFPPDHVVAITLAGVGASKSLTAGFH